jgi:hypothetical protein
MTETPIAQVDELLRQIVRQLEIQDDAYSPQAAHELLTQLEKNIPGDRRLKALKARIDERNLRLQEKRIYEETKEELEKLWQRAREYERATLIPTADTDKAYYKKAADRAEAVANTYPDFLLLKELVAIAEQQREHFLEKSRALSTLLQTKGIKGAIKYIQRLAPNEAVDLFDLDGHPLGKFTRDGALSRMEAIAADFAAYKMQEYVDQAEAYLAEHNPGAAKGVLERALKLYGLSGNDEAEIKRKLNLDIRPALQARQKAEGLIQNALYTSDAEAAWRIWKEASQTDLSTPKLADAKLEILKGLNAELLRRLDSIKPLLASSLPEDWEQAEKRIKTIITIAVDDSEAFSEILEQAYKLNSQFQKNITYRDLVNREINEAQNIANKSDFLVAQKLLDELKEKVRNDFGSWSDILAEIESLSQEILDLRKALRDLSEARAYLEAGKSTDYTVKLLLEVLSLTYDTPPAAELKAQAKLLIGGKKLRQITRRENYQRRIDDLRLQANTWFWGSIFTALVLLGLSIYMILVALNRNNPLSSLTSLVSLIPVLATKLVYDQSTAANKRADQLLGEMQAESEKEDKES